jgi:hypothetical protein
MPRAYGHRLHTFLFSKIPRLSVFSGLKTHKHPTPHYVYIALEWTGGRRKVEIGPRLLCLVLFVC